MGALMAAKASPSPRPPLNPQFSPGLSPEALAGLNTRFTLPTTPDARFIGTLSCFLKDDGNDAAKGGGRLQTVFSFRFSVKRKTISTY
jgi:hypothetical protein